MLRCSFQRAPSPPSRAAHEKLAFSVCMESMPRESNIRLMRVTAPPFEHPSFPDHALVDSGGAEKLERFGSVVLRRPDPQALWPRLLPDAVWNAADLCFVRESDRGGHWESRAGRALEEWTIGFGNARFLIRPTPFKHVGIFPEQASNWVLLERFATQFDGGPPRLLNLFGYTGAASVIARQAGYEVTHVDASRTMLRQARENAVASGLPEDCMRVLLEDALTFCRREVRRGSEYHVILMDPPHSGRGPKGEKWRFETGIAPLVAEAGKLLAERSFLCLSTYAIGFSPLSLANLLSGLEGGECDVRELALPEGDGERSGRYLPAGFCARWWRGLADR